MEKRKVVVCSVVAVLGLLSAATGFSAEATKITRSQVEFNPRDPTQCSYPQTPAYYLGITSAISLLFAQIIASVASDCVCCRRGPQPTGTNWAIALICFIISWFTFAIAFFLLLGGAALNNQQNNDTMYFGTNCYIVKPGVLAGGALLSLVTIVLGIIYYFSLNSTKRSSAIAGGQQQSNSFAAGSQTGIAMGQPRTTLTDEEAEGPVFVHPNTYMRRQFP